MVTAQADQVIADRVLSEESPHSTGHDTGEFPGQGNLSDRATETYHLATGKGEMVV